VAASRGFLAAAGFSCFQVEDESEIGAAEAEMDEVDRGLGQRPRKRDVRRKYMHVGTRLMKMLSKYRMKLDFRCNSTSPCDNS